MKYKITHTTKYEYGDVVPVCQNVLYLTPRNTPTQNCLRHRLVIHPHPTATHRCIDYFGNTVHYTTVDKGHRQLQIRATSTVECEARQLPALDSTAAWESARVLPQAKPTADELSRFQFVFPSPHIPFLNDLGEYARQSFTAGRPVLEALADFNARVYHDFEYDPTATNVATPISEVFAMRRGVCQDLAHLMLGALRTLGLASRYVSGYLHTHPPEGKPRLVGADASHAWLAVYCGELGWVDVDPTNNLFPGEEHICLAWGRDFRDVCPVAGMYVGGGAQVLSVSVDVAEVAA